MLALLACSARMADLPETLRQVEGRSLSPEGRWGLAAVDVVSISPSGVRCRSGRTCCGRVMRAGASVESVKWPLCRSAWQRPPCAKGAAS